MVKESCNLIGREHIILDNSKVYVIHEEKTLLSPYNSINLSFRIICFII